MQTQIKVNITTEEDADIAIRKASRDNPNKIVYAYGRFGIVDIYLNDRQPTTDCPATIQTYERYGGFFKNGKIVKPTKTWMARYNYMPVSR